MARALAIVVALTALLWTALAHAFEPPPISGHVLDTAGVLSQAEALRLDRKLDAARRSSGFAVVVFVPRSLEGESIDDVAYATFNKWKVGSAKGDDGVLLVVAPKEHKTRIETGKGVGGALTDIQSSHINREIINPRLKTGDFYGALDKGTDAILRELTEGTPGGGSEDGRGDARRGAAAGARRTSGWLKAGAVGAAVLLVIFLAIVSPTFREILFWLIFFGRGGGGGGGSSGGSGGGYGGGGGDGGSGYGGDGGSSGGGGSSDGW